MSRLRRVDVDERAGTVTIGPRARNTDVYNGLQPHGVAFSAGRCPSVAISGLALGGGFGFSSRKLGLSSDALLETDVVTASGRLGLGSSGRPGATETTIECLGQFFGPKKDLLSILDPVLTAATPTKRLIAPRTFWQAKNYFFDTTPFRRFAVKSNYRRIVSANLDWLDGLADAVRPHASRQAYQNFIDRSLRDWHQAYYGANFGRLVRVKSKYDPDGLFQFEQGIPTHV